MGTCMFYVFSLYYHEKIMIVLDLEFIVGYDEINEFRFTLISLHWHYHS